MLYYDALRHLATDGPRTAEGFNKSIHATRLTNIETYWVNYMMHLLKFVVYTSVIKVRMSLFFKKLGFNIRFDNSVGILN